MSIKDRFKTDPAAASSGVWIELDANSDGTIPRFLLARKSKQNRKYSHALQKALAPYTAEDGSFDLKGAKDEDAEALLLDVFVQAVLLGWENFQPEDDGNSIPHSVATAKSIMGSAEWHDLRAYLEKKAEAVSTFNVKKLEAVVKNS